MVFGMAAGLAVSAGLVGWMNALEVHQRIVQDLPDRVYVSTDCIHCQAAITAITEHPGPRPLAIIPVDAFDSPARAQLCAAANRAMRDTGALQLVFWSEAKFCRTLVAEARAFVEANDSVEVPAWVIGGEALAPGWTRENVTHLQRAGLLSAQFEFP